VGVERSITPVGLQIWLAETGFQTRRALCLCLADEPREESQDVSAGEGGSWAAVIAYDPLVVSKPRSNSIRGNSTVSLLHYKTNRVLRRRSLRWATMRAALVFCTARSHALPQRLLGRPWSMAYPARRPAAESRRFLARANKKRNGGPSATRDNPILRPTCPSH